MLEGVHAGLGQRQPVIRAGLGHGQVEHDQTEFVAQLAHALGRSQVDRHHRAQGGVVDVHATPFEVGAQGAGHRGDQHVVDLGAVAQADRLDVGNRERLGPGDALGRSELAFQRRGRVVLAQQFAHQHAGAGAQRQCAPGGAGDGIDGGRQQALVHLFDALAPGAGRLQGRRARRRVVQLLEQDHHGGAVGDAVMASHDQRTATVHIIDNPGLPQRNGMVERGAGDVVDQSDQRRLVVRCRQADVVQVLVDVEIRHVLPVRRGQREPGFDHALAEALEGDQPFAIDLTHPVEIERLLGQGHAHHDREVRRAVVVEPGRIGGGHGVGFHDVSLSIPPCHAAGQGGPPPGWSVFRTC